MAYEKQEWADDDTTKGKVNATRMTHIEQGIYDNSLATDKINPSGTATTSAEIEAGQISDVIGFKSLKLKGQTNQYTTTGKNKFNVNGTITTRNNATAVITNDVLKQTNTGTYSRTEWLITGLTANTDYTLKCKYSNPSGASIQLRLLKSDNSTTIANSSISTSTSGTLEATGTTTETSCYIRIYSNTLNESNNKVVEFSEIQLESGSSATSYEKYTGEKASPNPDYPQDVNNVSGDNVVEISNKNLIEYSFKGYNITSQGKFETGGTSLDFDVHIAKVKAGTTYTITPATNVIAYFDEKPTITSQAYNNSREVITNTNRLTPTRSSYIAIRTATSNTAQLEKGTSATSFVAHQGNNFEINLGKNLIQDETFVQGSYLDNTSTTRISCRNAKLKANTTYMISSTLNYSNYNIAVVTSPNQFPLANSSSVKYDSGWKNANFSFTTGNDDVYINIAVKKLPDGVVITPSDVAGIKFQIEKGAIATPYAPYFQPIYLGKIGTYCNDIRKYNGKWYWHKEIGKVILDGVNYKAGTKSGTTANIMYTTGNIPNLKPVSNNGVLGNLITSHFKNTTTDIIYSGDVIGIGQRTNEQISIGLGLSSTLTTLELFNTWLTNNNVDVYYPLATPIDEEITYAPLLRQLDEVYNSGLYDVTNISQDNSSEAFILDLEACKNNINGIVEYIRR